MTEQHIDPGLIKNLCGGGVVRREHGEALAPRLSFPQVVHPHSTGRVDIDGGKGRLGSLRIHPENLTSASAHSPAVWAYLHGIDSLGDRQARLLQCTHAP